LKNEPLNSTEHTKILIFLFLAIPTVLMLVGILPVLFLAFGFIMMKKNNDFSSVEVSVKIVKIYCHLMLVLFFSLLLWEIFYNFVSYDLIELMVIIPLGILLPYSYYFAVEYLYLRPLKTHQGWVTQNGVFSKEPKDLNAKKDNSNTKVEIFQSDKLKPYSVADELHKWAKLKEEGHVTEEEFNMARSKLLNRP